MRQATRPWLGHCIGEEWASGWAVGRRVGVPVRLNNKKRDPRNPRNPRNKKGERGSAVWALRVTLG